MDALLASAWSVPLTLVVAPAGSGKTTLLAQFATAGRNAGRPVAWYQAESAEAEVADLLRHLEESLRAALPSLNGGWTTVAAAAATLDTWTGPPAVLVIDDLHALATTPAEAALEQLIGYLPQGLHIVSGARRPPSFNLPRLRVSNQLLEIGPDDLRFRSWEVEELFRNHYREPLAPEELAELARRTDGWAAGLQLFHLATRGKPASERRRVLASLSSRLRDVRDYLARNVLQDLEDQLRDFLVRTSVLGLLSGPWCDQLLDRTGSDRLLADIERRHLFLTTDDGGTTYREHEVLRSHLEELLVEELGEAAARDHHRLAGRILEEGGALSEALRAYCRAQDWPSAERLLGRSGDRVFDRPGAWIEPLPTALADHDAWVLLATARRQLAAGDWKAALGSYRRGEDAFGGALASAACRRERFALAGWIDPSAVVSVDWTFALRRALMKDPLAVALDASDSSFARYGEAASRLVAGLAALAGGRAHLAGDLFDKAADAPDASPTLARFAHLSSAATAGLTCHPDAERMMTSAVEKVEPLVAPWIGRLLTAIAGGGLPELLKEADAARTASAVMANPWIDAVIEMVTGTTHLLSRSPEAAIASLGRAQAAFQQLGAPVVGAWAAALGSLASARLLPGEGSRRAATAAQLAHSVGCPGALALANRVRAAVEQRSSPSTVVEAQDVVDLEWLVRSVLATEEQAPADSTAESLYRPTVDVRSLVTFEIAVNGRKIDVGAAKPRVRSLLHLLSLDAGRPVHRDRLLAALWPDDDSRSGTRSLQVAVSALRHLFERDAGPGAGAAIVRDGDGYALLPGGGTVDLLVFAEAVERGRMARQAGRTGDAAASLAVALETYRGELLPEEGTAEWVLDERERYRMTAAEVAQSLATCLLETGNPDGAVAACERGLEIDRYRDGLWRAMIAAHDHNGDRAAAARATLAYQLILDELGIDA